MARTRSIRRTRKKKKNHFPFFSEQIQAFVARRLYDGFSFFLLGAGLFLLVSFLSYSHGDPSWNTSSISDAEVQNWLGLSGAWLSDIFLQTLGLGAYAVALGLTVWGVRLFRRENLSPLLLRFFLLSVSSVAFSIAFALMPSQGYLANPTFGGSGGALLLDQILGTASSFLSFSLLPLVVVSGFGLIGLAAFLYAAAVTREEFEIVKSAVFSLFAQIVFTVLSIAQRFYAWILHYNDSDYRPEPFRIFRMRLTKEKQPRQRAENRNISLLGEGDNEEFYSEQEPLRPVLTAKRPPTIPVVAKPSPSSPKTQTTQQRFNLSDGEWELPGLDLIQDAEEPKNPSHLNEEALRRNAELLQNVLADFNIEGEIVSIHPGPVVTLYELEPAPGTKSSRIISLSDDIARSMSAVSVRIAVVPGRNVIGIELPNKERQVVFMQELLASRLFEKTNAKLPLILGKDIGGQPIMADLAKMPHLLVAGTTGSGKSVAVNTMILSLLFRLPPEKCRFIMIDPKMLELSVYDDIPHLLSPVVTEPGKAVVALKWTVQEMEDRYRAMSKLGVRNIEGYNDRLREAREKGETIMRKVQTGFDPETGEAEYEEQPLDLTELPYIVVVVDEFADLMLVAGKDVENAIQRLAQMARAAGIHLLMATQRPSVDVITGVIKANFPTRISFQVTSKIDSRTILGEGGAEQLLGMGDMLYMAPGGRITRVHGPFVSDEDVEKVTNFLRSQGDPAYLSEVTEDGEFGDSEVMSALFGDGESSDNSVDELYDHAVALIAREGKVSTSFIQRHLQIGYNRAARIVEEMERQGIISKANATGKREILVRDFSDV